MTGRAPWDDLFAGTPGAEAPRPGPRVYSVFELNTAASAALRGSLGEVWVEGEISNLRDAGSGHLYFTLKDEQAAIDAVMFRSSRARLDFTPENGRRVTARGEPTVYEPRGKFQIVLREMKPAGLGALFEAFERMKKELAAAGWFDRRRPIPMLPRRIGVVTSPHGAALRDILHVLGRRCPSVPVLLAPCRVQGEGAAAEIAAAITALNDPRLGIGTIIVARGGGSIEELWAFNERVVAAAVRASRVPVISGVGHETDFTICDFVADLRAPTPSAAAERAVPDRADLRAALGQFAARLRGGMRRRMENLRARTRAAAAHRVFHEPRAIARRGRDRVANADQRLRAGLRRAVDTRRRTLDERRRALRLLFGRFSAARMQTVRGRLAETDARLRALNPRGVLERGYTLALDDAGRVVRRAAAVRGGQALTIEWHDGRARTVVADLWPTLDDPETNHARTQEKP